MYEEYFADSDAVHSHSLLRHWLIGAVRPPGMRGYIAFEDLSYNDVAERKVHATAELRRHAGDKQAVTTMTDEHGSYDFGSVSPGEYVLRISSPGYRVYETEIYLPSDFIGNLAVMLKKEKHYPEAYAPEEPNVYRNCCFPRIALQRGAMFLARWVLDWPSSAPLERGEYLELVLYNISSLWDEEPALCNLRALCVSVVNEDQHLQPQRHRERRGCTEKSSSEISGQERSAIMQRRLTCWFLLTVLCLLLVLALRADRTRNLKRSTTTRPRAA